MEKSVVTKTKFSQTNDKRFYNLNGVTSLPMGRRHLKDLTAYKESKGEKIEKYFIEKKENLKKLEIEAFDKNDRLNLYNQMLDYNTQNFEYYNLKDNTKVDSGNLFQTTQSFLLKARSK